MKMKTVVVVLVVMIAKYSYADNCMDKCLNNEGYSIETCIQRCEDLEICIQTCEDKSGVFPKCPGGMAYIPPGEFMMSCDFGGANECENNLKIKPDNIAKGFCMDKHEITYEEFKEVMITTLEYTNDCGPFCPILFVTYEKASEYCHKSDKRLPTEMEWEYAARGNTQTRYFWGDEMDGDYLWHKDNSGGRFQPVGLKQPNQFGLFDMLGNAYEYVYQDCENDSCDKITIRGGAYSTAEPGSSAKTLIDYDDYNSYTGFRCAKDIE